MIAVYTEQQQFVLYHCMHIPVVKVLLSDGVLEPHGFVGDSSYGCGMWRKHHDG